MRNRRLSGDDLYHEMASGAVCVMIDPEGNDFQTTLASMSDLECLAAVIYIVRYGEPGEKETTLRSLGKMLHLTERDVTSVRKLALSLAS